MLKLNSLRALIEQCIPDLQRDPERLKIIGEGGHVVATGTASLSFEYRYTAFVTILDYTGHTDALFVPLLAWMQVNQSEQLDNEKTREKAIQFELHHLTNSSVDIGIWLDLTERAIVRRDPLPDAPGRVTVTHPDEPRRAGEPSVPGREYGGGEPGGPNNPLPERWELWLKNEKLAEWDQLPAPARDLFRPALK
ncbi:MAG: phage tail protein [Desulfovibrionaceae bacterium]|jgi:hypothetical protein|nr:phage tail protein [Desulfovibrionaceae bacterium]